jgi:ABC-type Fe3+ transport system permease subunit
VPRRSPSLFSLFLTVALLFLLWAPLVQLGARALVLATQNPSIWHENSPFFTASRSVLLSTVELCVFSAIGATLLGVPLGFCIARGPQWARVLAAIGAALPLGVPPVILAAPFVSARGASEWALFYAALTLALSFYPLVALSTGAALLALPRGEEEAALGFSSPFRAWFGILGQRIAPAIWGGAGAVGALCAWEMGAPDLLGAPSFGMSVYRALNSPQILAPGESAARAWLSALPVPILALLFLLPAARALQNFAGESGQNSRPVRGALWGVLVLVLSPGFILWKMTRAFESGAAAINTIIANNDALLNTLLTSTISATISTFGALFFLVLWRHWPRSWRKLALILALLPGLSAPVVLGVALIEFYNRAAFAPLYDSSLGMIIIGHLARFFPFALALLWAPVSRLPADATFAAQNLGGSPLQTLFSIEIPLLKAALSATFATIWALCAGELTITVLVQGPGGAPLPLPIFNLLHAGLAADVAALCALLMALCGGAMAIALLFARRKS